MPGLDRTGPRGEGPRTGRQMGRCASPGKTRKGTEEPDDTVREDLQSDNEESFDMDRLGPFRGRGAGWGPGRGTGRGTGRGMGRGVGRFRRRKRGN